MRKLLSLLMLGGLLWSLALPAHAAGPNPIATCPLHKAAGPIKIDFVKAGGIAGMRFKAQIDSKNLSPEETRQLRKLIEEANFFKLPATFPDSGIRDGFGYSLTIEMDG